MRLHVLVAVITALALARLLTATHDPARWSEHRGDRPYDEQDPSTIRLPNGTRVASFDRGFLNAATREALNQWETQR